MFVGCSADTRTSVSSVPWFSSLSQERRCQQSTGTMPCPGSGRASATCTLHPIGFFFTPFPVTSSSWSGQAPTRTFSESVAQCPECTSGSLPSPASVNPKPAHPVKQHNPPPPFGERNLLGDPKGGSAGGVGRAIPKRNLYRPGARVQRGALHRNAGAV